VANPWPLLALQDTTLAAFIRPGDVPGGELGVPIIETVHVLALATVYGTVADGGPAACSAWSRARRACPPHRRLLPWTCTAFAIAVSPAR